MVVERIKSTVIRKPQLYKRVHVRNVIYDEVSAGLTETTLSKFEEQANGILLLQRDHKICGVKVVCGPVCFEHQMLVLKF